MIGWQPFSDRLLLARFNSKQAKLTIIVCYSSIEDKEGEDQDFFYEELLKAMEETPVHDAVLILDDLNAKVGTNNQGKESTIGKYGCGVIDNNGCRVVDFYQENILIIGDKILRHKNIHKFYHANHYADRNSTK